MVDAELGELALEDVVGREGHCEIAGSCKLMRVRAVHAGCSCFLDDMAGLCLSAGAGFAASSVLL